jgi:hypothetical protein
MALDPDMSGVCRVEGTFEISSKPRKMARTKTKVKNTASIIFLTY